MKRPDYRAVKLIASDLDGTLLYPDKRLPPQIFSLIERLHACGVSFLPASGRQYANLKKLFAPVADKVFFLCENGALVKQNDKTLILNAIDDKQLKPAIDAVRSVPDLRPVLCGADCAYVEDENEQFSSVTFAAYTNCRKVDRLDGVIGKEPICKISVYDEVSASENGMKALPALLPSLRVMQSGFKWCDVSAPDCNKGHSLEQLCLRLGIGRTQCIAFGDHMNDYEMLSFCDTAYVTENAFPPLKNKFACVPSDADGGVLVKLQEILSVLEGESL